MISLVRRAAVVALFTSSIVLPALADSGSGAYLAGRQAIYQNDYSSAERYYAQALKSDPENAALLESVVVARLALGEVRRALPVALMIEDIGLPSQAARMVITANLVADGKLDELLALSSISGGEPVTLDSL